MPPTRRLPAADSASQAPLADPPAFLDIWSPLCAGTHPQLGALLGKDSAAASPAEVARMEKFLKGRLAAAADHFNRDQKRGFQYLQVCAHTQRRWQRCTGGAS